MSEAAVPLRSKVVAELIGTGFLVATVIGSGIMATRLSPDDPGLQLLESSLATGAVLMALILALQPVSAAFNPVVSALQALYGAIGWREAGVLGLAQVAGGAAGAIAANLMFDLGPIALASTDRSGAGQWLAEVIATFGLTIVIFAAALSGRSSTIAYAVGAYIAAAYWFTSSTSFANPAVTVARTLSDTFAGVNPTSVPGYVTMQLIGGLLAYAALRTLHPAARHPLTERNPA